MGVWIWVWVWVWGFRYYEDSLWVWVRRSCDTHLWIGFSLPTWNLKQGFWLLRAWVHGSDDRFGKCHEMGT